MPIKFPFHLDIKRKMRKTEYLTLKINRRKEKKKFKYEINFQFVEQMEWKFNGDFKNNLKKSIQQHKVQTISKTEYK